MAGMCSAWTAHAQGHIRVLREVTRTKTAEDAESKIAVRFVNENDSKKISTDSKQCSSDSSVYESCSEEEEISVSEEDEIQTENELESASETPERSCSDDTSPDEGEEMKKSDSLGKQKPTTLNSSTYAKTIKKAIKKIN